MNYGFSTKTKGKMSNYFSKQNSKGKAFQKSKINNTIISIKEEIKSPIRTVHQGISNGQNALTKFKTTQNSPDRSFKHSGKMKNLHNVSGEKKNLMTNQNLHRKGLLSSTKINRLINDSIAFDQLFMHKMKKIHTKKNYSIHQLTHSNLLYNNPNKISFENSHHNNQYCPKNTKHQQSKKDSFFYKRNNITFEEEEEINKQIINFNYNLSKGINGNEKMTSPRIQSGSNGKNQPFSGNKLTTKENYIQSINIKDFQYLKTKNQFKKKCANNKNSKSNQQLYIKYSNALLHNKVNKNAKISGITLPFEQSHSKSIKNISSDIISKTTCHTKNNSRKPSGEKNLKILSSNPLIQSLEMNNYILSNKIKSSLASTKGSTSSLIKQRENVDYHITPSNNQAHLKGFSEIPNMKISLNTSNKGNRVGKSSQFSANSNNFLKLNDMLFIKNVTSNVKNHTPKTTSSITKSSKKHEDLKKEFLQTKIKFNLQNKAVTTKNTKQNSNSTSRVEEFTSNLNVKTQNNNETHTGSRSPMSKSNQEILNMFNKKNSKEEKQIEENKKKINNKIGELFLEKIEDEIKHIESENVSIDKILNETIHSLQSTVRESAYYRHEMEKISCYIREYKKLNDCYPESKINFYKYGRLIGKGAFGKVNLALHICSGRLVAIKSFNKSNLKNQREKSKIINEINALRKLQHPFISQILDSFETDKHICIVMEYVCGDLLSFIRKRSKLSESASKVIFRQIIEGLEFIHLNKIVHRDIKLDNILIDLNNTVKICDFGVSRKIHPGDIMHEHCGTLAYIAPEIFKNIGYKGFSCDVWSAGVTLYYMLSGVQPFKVTNKDIFHEKIIIGKYEKLKTISSEARDLIDGMLQVDTQKRLTIQQILSHPWLSGTNLKYRGNINLFTNAEKTLLRKYDVNYLRSNKEEMVENFTMKNLDTIMEDEKKNGNTKSLILAPYNSYNSSISSISSEDIKIENGLSKFAGKVKQANIKYELNNNEDFDNGVIITQNESNENIKDNDKELKDSFSNKNSLSKPISPNAEFNDEINIISGLNSPNSKIRNESNIDLEQPLTIRENIVREIEGNLGYDYGFVINSLNRNEVNYATATYHLLTKDFNDNITR